jgi:ComF family protein
VAFTAIRSWAIFSEPLQTAIHKLKYRQDRGLGIVLAQPLIDLLRKYHWKIDLIIPVPLDTARRKERGYNQSALLARPISWQTGIPYSNQTLFRERITKQQVGLSIFERAENMAGAFRADRYWAAGKNILVIDDVITTGSTINACAGALIKAGAIQVYGMTLARSKHG